MLVLTNIAGKPLLLMIKSMPPLPDRLRDNLLSAQQMSEQ